MHNVLLQFTEVTNQDDFVWLMLHLQIWQLWRNETCLAEEKKPISLAENQFRCKYTLNTSSCESYSVEKLDKGIATLKPKIDDTVAMWRTMWTLGDILQFTYS